MIFHLTLILIPLVLLALFLILVSYEERRGTRLVLAGYRHHLDRRAARAAFVIKHVDWGAFMSHLTRTSLERLLHDLAHSTLIVVRLIERQLTRVVRTLRARRDEPILPARSAERPSRLESAVTLVKKTVRSSRKVLPPSVEE
jgi:hypothetical protein